MVIDLNNKKNKENSDLIKLTAYSDVGFAEDENNLPAINPNNLMTIDTSFFSISDKLIKNILNIYIKFFWYRKS